MKKMVQIKYTRLLRTIPYFISLSGDSYNEIDRNSFKTIIKNE